MSKAEIITLDTNVLVRVVIDDPAAETQMAIARATVKQARQVYIPQIVQIETVWVCESCYGLDKTEIISMLEHLQQNQAFRLQQGDAFNEALHSFKENNVDFADCLILAEGTRHQSSVVTFDKRFAKLKGVRGL